MTSEGSEDLFCNNIKRPSGANSNALGSQETWIQLQPHLLYHRVAQMVNKLQTEVKWPEPNWA